VAHVCECGVGHETVRAGCGYVFWLELFHCGPGTGCGEGLVDG